MVKKHLNKSFVMTEDDERSFKSSNKCWICGGLFAERDNKARNHDHVTGKYRGFAHGDCIISFKLTKKIPIIFHDLRGYGSHFVMQEIGKIGVKIDVLPNGLEKQIVFAVNRNLVVIDSM